MKRLFQIIYIFRYNDCARMVRFDLSCKVGLLTNDRILFKQFFSLDCLVILCFIFVIIWHREIVTQFMTMIKTGYALFTVKYLLLFLAIILWQGYWIFMIAFRFLLIVSGSLYWTWAELRAVLHVAVSLLTNTEAVIQLFMQ